MVVGTGGTGDESTGDILVAVVDSMAHAGRRSEDVHIHTVDVDIQVVGEVGLPVQSIVGEMKVPVSTNPCLEDPSHSVAGLVGIFGAENPLMKP